MPPSKSLFSSSLFPPAPFFATRTTAHTPFFIFLPPFRFVKADDVSARSRSRASKKRGWARERSASSSRFFFRRKHRCFLFWNSNACCAPPLRTLFRSLSARPLSVNAFRDASRGRLRWLLGRLRTVRGRWRGRGKAFFNASLSIQRNAWKRKRGAPFPSFRASRPSPSPLVLARDPSRDAHGRLPKPTRERCRRQRQDKAFWGGAALFCPLAFFFFAMGATTTTLRPSALVVVDFLARSLLSLTLLAPLLLSCLVLLPRSMGTDVRLHRRAL